MAIKLLKSLTFASDGQLCASMSLESVRRNLQRLPMAALAFSLSRRVQVTLTAPPSLPRPVHGQYAIKTILLSKHLRSHQAWLVCGSGGGWGGGFRRRSGFDASLQLLEWTR